MNVSPVTLKSIDLQGVEKKTARSILYTCGCERRAGTISDEWRLSQMCSYHDGYDEGHTLGHDAGYDAGYQDGYTKGSVDMRAFKDNP